MCVRFFFVGIANSTISLKVSTRIMFVKQRPRLIWCLIRNIDNITLCSGEPRDKAIDKKYVIFMLVLLIYFIY